MENTALLTEQLRSLGLYAAPTVGDGNCLFRALSDQLYGSPSKHPQLRRDVCDWIARHKARYEPFVEDERGLDVHLRCMRENATYGGHMELSAFAHLTRRNVKVIQPGLVYVIEWAAGGGPPSPTSLTSSFFPRYHDWEHFSSIRNLKGPHTGPPIVRETPPYPYPPSPSSSSSDPNPKQSKADAKERKRMEVERKRLEAEKKRADAEAKERKRAERERRKAGEGDPEKKRTVLPKVRLKLSSASPTKALPPALPEAGASGSSLGEGGSGPATSVGARLRSRLGAGASGSGSGAAPGGGRVQRSPKRSFDESSAGSAGSESESVAKRTRSAGTSLSLSLSPPALSSSSSLSSLSSMSPSPPPEPVPVPVVKPMTRRQRKALGLPKPRGTSVAGGAGKIVIPGGRYEGTGEWKRNGTGRVDVRGFRELKI
ncbi:hypothetical protein C8R46DRAFT_1165706 [Mycena filopes]|nr:hypothetical protein C8R46DRAFT_1165706 [Mycena filopes]